MLEFLDHSLITAYSQNMMKMPFVNSQYTFRFIDSTIEANTVLVFGKPYNSDISFGMFGIRFINIRPDPPTQQI